MTVAFDDGAPRMRRFRSEWIGHYWLRLMVGYDIVTAPLLWLHGITFEAVSVVTVLPAVLLIMHGLRHEVKLCEPCGTKIPLDGQAAAAGRRRTLRAVHWLSRRHGFSMPRLRLSFQANRNTLLILAWVAGSYFLPTGPWWGVLGAIVVDTYFCSTIPLYRIHQRLQPWCPQCHWGDGGDEEISPEPAPSHGLVPSGSA